MYDIEDLLTRMASDRELAAEILESFAADIGRLETEAKRALSGSSDDIRRIAHQIKGSAKNVGAHALSDAAEQAEALALDGHTPALGEHLERVLEQLGRCRAAAPEALASLKNQGGPA